MVGRVAPAWATSLADGLSTTYRVHHGRDPAEPAHLLLLEPDVALALTTARARRLRPGTTWVLTGDHPVGAAVRALHDVAAVEGRQRVHSAVADAPPSLAELWAWLGSHPGPRQGPTGPAYRLEPATANATGPADVSVASRGPLSARLAGGHGPEALVIEAPPCPLARLSTAPDASELARPPDGSGPVVLSAACWTHRPGSAVEAMRAAAAAWHLSRSDRPWAHVGPVGGGPRTLGIAGVPAEAVRRGVGASRGEAWLDVHWETALDAFPHLRALAGHLVAHPVLRRGRAARLVAVEAARLLQRTDVPLDRPLAELGVDSLLAEELRQRLVTRFGRDLPLTLVLDHPTAAAIGRVVADLSSGTAP